MPGDPPKLEGSGPDASSGATVGQLDCTGLLCPLPIIELAKAAASMRPGDIIELTADDPAAAVDVAAWARMRGHTVIESSPPHYVVRLA